MNCLYLHLFRVTQNCVILRSASCSDPFNLFCPAFPVAFILQTFFLPFDTSEFTDTSPPGAVPWVGLSRCGHGHRSPCFCVYLRVIALAIPLFFNCLLLVCFTEFLSTTHLLKIKIKTFLIVLCFLIEAFRPFTFSVKLDTPVLIFPILLFAILYCCFVHFPLSWRGGQCTTPSLLVPECGRFTELFRSVTV